MRRECGRSGNLPLPAAQACSCQCNKMQRNTKCTKTPGSCSWWFTILESVKHNQQKTKHNFHHFFETTPIDLVSTVRISSWFNWASFALSEFLFTINLPLLPKSNRREAFTNPENFLKAWRFEGGIGISEAGFRWVAEGCPKTTEVDGSNGERINGVI